MNRVQRGEWLSDLLVDEATQGLCDQDQLELERLLEEEPIAESERLAFFRAATATELAFAILDDDGASAASEFPAELDRKLLRLVESVSDTRPPDEGEAPPSNVLPFDRESRAHVSPAWWLAAAAAILAGVAWWPRLSTVNSEDASESTTLASKETSTLPPAAPNYGLTLEMAGTEDPAGAGATGTLLWDADRQQGVMQISGLEVNDPTAFQYQLWIFDATRDDRHPIDGGVFDMLAVDVDEDGFVSIPIDARLPVGEPTLFAITIEKPGGVVVSERERIVMVAAAA